MARVNTPEHYTSHMYLVKPEDIKKYKYRKKNTKLLIETASDKGYKPYVVNCPALSNRDFYIHLKHPQAKTNIWAYSYFKWNNVNFKFKVYMAEGKRYISVENVGREYVRKIDISKVTISKKYRNLDKDRMKARYLIRIAIIAKHIAQTMIESYGKEALQEGKRYWDMKCTKIKNFVGLMKLVRSRKFAWREQYYKNIEIRKAKVRRYRNAMKIANNPENVKRGLAIMKSIVNDPTSVVSKIIRENPGVLKEIQKEDAA